MLNFKQMTIGALAAMSLSGAAMADTRLQGAGATFPAPLYFRLVAEFQKSHPDLKIDYQSIGSGGGIKGITDATVDFAGSDAPMSKKELDACNNNIVQIPSCAGGVVPAYNLPGVKGDVKFTGAILAEIYLGKITKWNDPKIAAVNEGVELPPLTITPVWRTDGSGTTYVWTNYLATQSEPFKTSVGTGKQVKWPIGQGGKGNEGVAQALQLTKGAIGYVEQNYANKNGIAYGAVKNVAGKFVKSTPEAVSAAGAAAAATMKAPVLAANLWNQPGDDAYPIASLTYLIVYKDLKNVKSSAEAQALVDFLWWTTHEGQKFTSELDYAPLAPAVQKQVEGALEMLTFSGKAIKPAN
jgi:phosphate transport system substrate-binding protein